MSATDPGSAGTPVEFHYGRPLEDTEVLKYFWECLKSSQEWFSDVREDATRLYDMYYGKTLTKTDEAYLIETWRSPISFPFATGTIDAIVGSDQADRKAAAFRGADNDFKGEFLAEKMTDLVRKAMDRCYGQRVESDAYLDMLVTGYGVSEGFLNTTKVPLAAQLKRVQLWEIWPDPDAVEDNLTDSIFVIRERPWLMEEVQARWPGKADELRGGIAQTGFSTPTLQVAGKWTPVHYSQKKDRVRIFHFQFKRYVPRVVYFDPQKQERVSAAPADLEARRKELDTQTDPVTGVPLYEPIEEHSYAAEVYYDAHIATQANAKEGGVLLDFQELSLPCFTYSFITGRKRKMMGDQRIRFFGPMATLHDAQMYINKSARVYLEILERGAKGGGFISRDAIVGSVEDFIKDRAKPGIWTVVDTATFNSPNGFIKENPVQPVPPGWESFMQFCIEMISAVTGVTDWWKGTATQDRANVFVSNMQERNTIMLNPVIEPLSAYRMQNGLLLASIIRKHIPTAELDRLVGNEDLIDGITGQPAQPDPQTGQVPTNDDGTPQLEPMMDDQGKPLTVGALLKQVDPLAFDVVVDVSEASPTQKQQVYAMFQSGLMEQMTKAGMPMDLFLPIFMKFMPLPVGDVKKFLEELEARMKEQKESQTQDGVVKTLKGMDPQTQQQVLQQAGLGPQDKKPPIEQINYKDLSPQAKVQMLAQAGIQISPEEAAMPPPGAAPIGPPGGAQAPPQGIPPS